MGNSDTDSDTTDNDTGGTGSAEVFNMHNDDSGVNVEEEEEVTTDQEESSDVESEDDQSQEVTNEGLEWKLRKLEAEVMILREEEMLLKQMLSGAITKQQIKNRLKFYKFSGFLVEKSHLPSDMRENLCKEEVSLYELRSLLACLQHICECTERKMQQFVEAEQDPGNAYGDGRINVSHKIFIFDNLHVEVAFQPTDKKYSHMHLVVYLLYNDMEIFFEPQGIQVESNGFSQNTEQRVKELFVEGCCQELKFTVYKAKNLISDVLQY